MKRILAVCAVICLLFCASSAVYACQSSGLLSADAAVSTAGGQLCGVLIVTDGSNDATVIVYNNASAASGNVLFKGKVAGAANFGGATWETTIRYNAGLYVDVTGTGAAYILYYK
jgi:hypothetical protein